MEREGERVCERGRGRGRERVGERESEGGRKIDREKKRDGEK